MLLQPGPNKKCSANPFNEQRLGTHAHSKVGWGRQ